MSKELLPIDFREVAARLRDAPIDRRRVLTVPVWGWTGDGKTCSVLTLFHYADAAEHGLELALVNDTRELEQAVAGVPLYEPLHLPELARSTADRLTPLAEIFLDNHRWPPGTDAPTPYLLRLAGVRETFGFLYLPDLQGGSYQATDGAARAVLSSADACAIMVDPDKYAGNDVESKKYKKEVNYRIQACVEAGISAAVMISKADRSPPENAGAVETTHVRLAIVVDGAESIRVFRVSVLGTDVDVTEDGEPPPVEDRRPDALLQAWMWLLAEALIRSAAKVLRSPPVRLAASVQQAAMPAQRVAEMRNMGTFSGPPGAVLCAVPSTAGPAFLVIGGEELFVAAVGQVGDKPTVQTLGRAPGLTEEGKVKGVVVGGEVFLGHRFDANAIWHGRSGDDLDKVGLPTELKCWCVTTSHRVTGVDAAGRVHLFARDGNRWRQVDFVADFIEKSEAYICEWLPRERALVVANGTAVQSVEVRPDGFGDRLSLPVNAHFDTEDTVRMSPLGLVIRHQHDAAISTISFGGVPLAIKVDALLEEAATAVAPDLPLAATLDGEGRLHVFRMVGGKVVHVMAAALLSGSDPSGMAWALGSPWLLVTFEESWSTYRFRGLDD